MYRYDDVPWDVGCEIAKTAYVMECMRQDREPTQKLLDMFDKGILPFVNARGAA